MKKGFTLIEIIITVIILGVIVTFAIPGYRNLVENSKAKVCELNLKVLLGAVDAYAVENDVLPASLGGLSNEHLNRAWAKVFEAENSWRIKLTYFFVDFNQRGLAYAQSAWLERYVGDIKYFTCPADTTPPPEGYSYGINSSLINMTFSQYRSLPSATTVVVADSNESTFTASSVDKRHKKWTITGIIQYAQEVKKDEAIVKNEEVEQLLPQADSVDEDYCAEQYKQCRDDGHSTIYCEIEKFICDIIH